MNDKRGLTLSIESGEIVFSPKNFKLSTSIPLRKDVVAEALRVVGHRGKVRATKDRKTLIWSSEKSLPLGWHTLVIGKLVSEKNLEITKEFKIPFFAAQTKARIPSTVVIRSMRRVRIDKNRTTRLPLTGTVRGPYFELMKGVQRGGSNPVSLEFDQNGRKIDATKAINKSLHLKLQKIGKIHPDLVSQMRRVKSDQRIPVAIWFRQDYELDFDQLTRQRNRREGKVPQQVIRYRKEIQSAGNKVLPMIKELGGREIWINRCAPTICARMSPKSIQALAKEESVVGIYHRDPRGYDDLDDSIEISRSDHVHDTGITGDGIRVAVWERAPDITTDLVIEDEYDATNPVGVSAHARLTHAIIKNRESGAPHGHAPDCLLYSANSYDLDALEWAIEDPECTVISQSFHRSAEQTSDDLSYDDIYKDWSALHWPFPTIVHAAGNDPSPNIEYVNHKGYNSISAGSHNDAVSSMASDSVYRNPATLHGDRELPEICANGTIVTAASHTSSGTSFAAPAVAGIVAQIQETAPILKRWPEGCRAILLAGARTNVKESTWWQDVLSGVDAADGSGAADALGSINISRHRARRNRAAITHGWDIGYLRNSDFTSNGLSNFSYLLRVPAFPIPIFGPRQVKVCLAWSSKVTTWHDIFPFLPESPISSVLAVDLDLEISDSAGRVVSFVGSWDNSYEIAEFRGDPGEVYRVRIRRWSGTEPTWFGIAWTVHGSLWIKSTGISLQTIQHIARILRETAGSN